MPRNRDDTHPPQTTLQTETFASLDATELRVPALTVLAHPDAGRVGDLVTLPELATGREVELSRLAPGFAAPGSTRMLPLEDPHLSRRPLRLVPGPTTGGVTLRRFGSSTCLEVDGARFDEERVLSAEDLELGVVLCLGHRVVLAFHLHHTVVPEVPSFGLVGASSATMRLRQEIQAVAGLDVPVLLRGESGTGKELVAQALHEAGSRRAKAFFTVNMAAIPSALASAALFGAARGAYTGADRKKVGYFARAHDGTLFLDEIGETPSDVQPILLRALESGEIQPVGASQMRRVDVRVVSATDADLDALVADGSFRKQLLHRLAGYKIRLPTLRERRSDFGHLFYHFLREELAALKVTDGFHLSGRPWPPADLAARLARHDWPGNVRELKNVARQLVIVRQSGALPGLGLVDSLIGPDVGSGIFAQVPPAPPHPLLPRPSGDTSGQDTAAYSRPPPSCWRPVYRRPGEVSEEELIAALRAHHFKVKPTAEALGIARGSLYDLIDASKVLRKASTLSGEEIKAALAAVGSDLDEVAARLEVSRPALKRRMKALGLG